VKEVVASTEEVADEPQEAADTNCGLKYIAEVLSDHLEGVCGLNIARVSKSKFQKASLLKVKASLLKVTLKPSGKNRPKSRKCKGYLS